MVFGFGKEDSSTSSTEVWDPEKTQAHTSSRDQRWKNRIDRPRQASIVGPVDVGDLPDGSVSVDKQIELESSNAIQYRTCSWPKTAALLFSEYICLAIMSFPWSYKILGLFPGLFLTIVVAGFVLYTSLTTWEFCMRHPEVKDVCDIGQMLFWGKRWAWWATGVMFVLNNTFIQALHCLVGAKYLNTVSNHAECTVVFAVIVAIISWICSMPRTFSMLSTLATFSAFFTFVSVMLAAIFAAVQDAPPGYPQLGGIIVRAFPSEGTTFVLGLNAFLNISYTFIGQITLPSFIAEMKNPKDFPKALWAVTICEIIVFSLVGGLIYGYVGESYITAPAFGSLTHTYEIVSFSFMIPTLIFLGVLYASVSARWAFFNIFAGTRHMGQHTVVGWASWAGILAVLWILAFIIAEVIPFFGDLLSLMSSLFDSFFGFIFWGVAYLRMRKADYGAQFWKARGARSMIGAFCNVAIILIGLFFLTAGTYASVQSIINGYEESAFGVAFSCSSNAIVPAVDY